MLCLLALSLCAEDPAAQRAVIPLVWPQGLPSSQRRRRADLTARGAVLTKGLNVMALNVTQQGCVFVHRRHGGREKHEEMV